MAYIGNLHLTKEIILVKTGRTNLAPIIESGGEAWLMASFGVAPGGAYDMRPGMVPMFSTLGKGTEGKLIVEALASQGYRIVNQKANVLMMQDEVTLQKVDPTAPEDAGETADFVFKPWNVGAPYVGSPCIVATTCYGSYEHPDVVVFRRWRDEVLMCSIWGRLFVETYYVFSPPIAACIGRLPFLSCAIRKLVLEPLARKLK